MNPATDTHADTAIDEIRGDWLELSQYPGLAADWTRLQAQADGSPFNSWSWVSTWLQHLPDDVVPRVFRARDADGVLALAVAVEKPEGWPVRAFGRRSLLLQETGVATLDEVSIEYTGVLARRGREDAAYRSLFTTLHRQWAGWRRFRVTATADASRIAAALPPALRAYCVHSEPSYRVDLAALRARGASHVSAVGRNTRHKLAQARRAYEAHGPLRVDMAGDADTALTWLEALRVLHERRWQARGKPGAFASPFFHEFHRDLVRRHHGDGLVHLARVSAGPVPVAYLYSLCWQGTLYFYNCGLNYGAVPRYDSPGVLGLSVFIQHALEAGYDVFDFLAGAQDYKRRLATGHRMLDWIDVCRLGLAHEGERWLARALRKPTFGQPLAPVVPA
jgi:CelD/BcsL family acetyltransferase involved in cellulose biosynthesis